MAKFNGFRQAIFVAVDIIVFTVIRGELNVLLIRRKVPPFAGQYALPGGMVLDNESLDQAAARELFEETNVSGIFMKKINAYGNIGRDPRGRVVSVAYMALVDYKKFQLKAHEHQDSLSAEWMPVGSVKKLAFDHNAILNDAIHELKYEVQTTNLVAQLLAEKFTLTELQSTYESILGKKLDKRNFRKRIKSFDVVSEANETRMDGVHRPAMLYKFRVRKYEPLKDRIQVFV